MIVEDEVLLRIVAKSLDHELRKPLQFLQAYFGQILELMELSDDPSVSQRFLPYYDTYVENEEIIYQILSEIVNSENKQEIYSSLDLEKTTSERMDPAVKSIRNVSKSIADLLKEVDPNHRLIKKIFFQRNQLKKLFDGLTYLFGYETHESYEPTNLYNHINSLMGYFEDVYPESINCVNYSIGSRLSRVEARQSQVKLIFDNLLNNAFRYSYRSQSKIVNVNYVKNHFNRLEGELPRQYAGLGKGEWVVVEIENSVPNDYNVSLEKIFDLYYSNEKKSDLETILDSGSGVGLALVKLIVLNQRGYVTATLVDNDNVNKERFFKTRIFWPTIQRNGIDREVLLRVEYQVEQNN